MTKYMVVCPYVIGEVRDIESYGSNFTYKQAIIKQNKLIQEEGFSPFNTQIIPYEGLDL